ncbi:MAG TPA: hypothetical protein VE621_07090 [Bryobacteraceae bacterium]|jgi:hypothetical protein|nr:hypothetical protein [Bryobacteraceae bacterium]
MTLLKTLQLILIGTVAAMLAQAAFAGRLLIGDSESRLLHSVTAKVLVWLAISQLVVVAALWRRSAAPRWLLAASVFLLLSEVLEYSAGELHNVALHVPLGVALFGAAIRQLLWSLLEAAPAGKLLEISLQRSAYSQGGVDHQSQQASK